MFGPSRMARDVGCVGWEREMISTRYVKDIEDDCKKRKPGPSFVSVTVTWNIFPPPGRGPDATF